MNGTKRSGRVPGSGQGQGGGRGRNGGPIAGGAVGNCLCPQCNHRQPHERGVPCMQIKCPQCGTAMIRE